jgi:hypothetical protein
MRRTIWPEFYLLAGRLRASVDDRAPALCVRPGHLSAQDPAAPPLMEGGVRGGSPMDGRWTRPPRSAQARSHIAAVRSGRRRQRYVRKKGGC